MRILLYILALVGLIVIIENPKRSYNVCCDFFYKFSSKKKIRSAVNKAKKIALNLKDELSKSTDNSKKKNKKQA